MARRLCTVAGFYRYAEEEGLLAVSPAVHVRPPRLDYESLAIGLDRNEVGALLVAAGLGPAIERALISVLALSGLRVSEATGANIESLGLERGHRTLSILRKGGKIVTIPLAPRTARAIDLAIGERSQGPIFTAPTAAVSTATGRPASCAGSLGGPGSPSPSDPIRCATPSSSPPSLDAGTPLRDVQEAACPADPRTIMRNDRARVSLDRHDTYMVSPSSPAPVGNAPRHLGAANTRRRPAAPDAGSCRIWRSKGEGDRFVLRAPSSVGLAKRDHEIGAGGAPHDEEENP